MYRHMNPRKELAMKETMEQFERMSMNDESDNRPASCRIDCAYGTYRGRPCLKDPLNQIDIEHMGRWFCILREYSNGTRTVQVLPL